MKPEENNQKRDGRKRGGIIILFAVVIVAMLGVIIYLLLERRQPDSTVDETAMRSTVVTEGNVNDVVEQMEQVEYVPPGYFTVSMTNDWYFPSGDAVSPDASVDNLDTNTNDIYFDVVLADDENTKILASPVIPRGRSWDEIKLDTPLPAGRYDCVMIYHLIDAEQNTVSTLRVGLTVEVAS